jgi:hypothetical protein
VVQNVKRTDVIFIASAQWKLWTWSPTILASDVALPLDEHMQAGMMARYQVEQ